MIILQTSKKLSKPIALSQEEKIKWMTRLLSKAKLIGDRGEVPIAAVILDKRGRCIGYGGNRRETMKDPLGHAELVALRQASWINNDWRFNDCTLIVNLEPCPMCAGAIINSRLKHLIFGAYDDKKGCCGSLYQLCGDKRLDSITSVKGGVLEDECSMILREFFSSKRE